MIELSVMLSAVVATFISALVLVRWLLACDAPGAELLSIAEAVVRASESLVISAGRRGLIAVVALAAAAGVAELIMAPEGFGTALAVAGTTILGAIVCTGVAYLATGIITRGTSRTVAALGTTLDHAVTVSMRAGGAAGIVTESAALGVVAVVLALGVLGSGAGTAEPPVAALAHATRLLPALGLGAAGAAIALSWTGGAFRSAAELGGRAFGIEQDSSFDTRNPALIARLIGDFVGTGSAHYAQGFVLSVVASAACVGVAVRESTAMAPGNSPLALAALPLIIRSSGLIASGFGIMSAHVDEHESPDAALLRGHGVSVITSVAALGGACHWLVGPGDWLVLFGAGAFGLLGAVLLGVGARLRMGRGSTRLLEIAQRDHDLVARVATGYGVGLVSTVGAFVVVGLSAWGSWAFGTLSLVQDGGLIGVAVGVSAMLALIGFELAASGFGTVALGASHLARTGSDLVSGSAQRRSHDFAHASATATSRAHAYATLSAASVVLLSALVLDHSGEPRSPGGLAAPALITCALLGGAIVCLLTGHALRRAGAAADAVAAEVHRQVAHFRGVSGARAVPHDHTPNYRACIDQGTEAALSRAIPASLLFLLLPAVLGFGLQVLYTADGRWQAVDGLRVFLVTATTTSLGVSVAVTIAGELLGAARSNSPSSDTVDARVDWASSGAGALGDCVRHHAQLVVMASALGCLLIAPLL